jgi:integrase
VSRTAIPIPPELSAQLAAHVATWRAETFLTDEYGHQLAPWTLERAMRAARVTVPGRLPDGFRYHDLRHYLALLLIAGGADVKVVQSRLPHVSAKTTLDTYMHLWHDADDPTNAVMGGVLAKRLADNLRTTGQSAG